MKIFENYNSAKQKYGVDLVDSLTKLGLPPLYLLSACRFIKDNGVTHERIICLFKEWKKYVVKYNDTDVNKLTYEEFFNLIFQEKSKHCVHNIIFTRVFTNCFISTIYNLNGRKLLTWILEDM